MARQKDKDLRLEDQNNNSKSTQGAPGRQSSQLPNRKPATDWEQPDFEELDLCMEVTTYVYHWQ